MSHFPWSPPGQELPDAQLTPDTPHMLGRLLALVTEINEKVSRLVWRADNQESRIEALEQWKAAQEALEKERAKPKLTDRLLDKALWLLLGLGALALFGPKLIPLL